MNMDKISERMAGGFESSSGLTPEFGQFAKDFRAVISAELKNMVLN